MDYGAIGIGAGIASAIFAGLAWLVANRSLKYQMLAELMKEYAQPGMHKAVVTLYHFFRHDCEEDVAQMKEKFEDGLRVLDKMKNRKEMPEQAKRICEANEARRHVSHFYQRMAALHEGHVLPDKMLYRMWRERDLRIIPNIIVPLEEVLIRRNESEDESKITEKNRMEEEDVLKLLTKLYEHSKGPGMTFP